ncbi:MAG: polysaccharide biosynthesis transport protein [Phycisphaerales bacterium]|jgi:capsular exopolysaccharide synthesis family protein|nr:polysaccharide biosynthesis transport protein [Phycisphaerales bacterium]
MSRDIQIYSQSHLPTMQDDLFHANALGVPGASGGGSGNANGQNSPLRKVQRLLRGREKLAIGLAICGMLVGCIVGWLGQKPKWVSSGVVWIRPIIPRLTESDKVMPFYQYYVQSQTAIITGPRVLERAVQSNEWKATGLPSNSDSVSMIKQDLEVVYAKNSQHILVSYTDERDVVAQAAVRSVIQAYRDIYSDANGQEMKSKLQQIEAKKDELDSAMRGIQGQMRALVEKHGHDDLSAIYIESQKRLMELRDKVRSTQMKLDSAMAGAPKEGENVAAADPTKGITLEMIASNDVTMREYIKTLEAMEFNLQRLARNVGPKSRIYADAAADVELQKQRINTYAESFRKNFTGQDIFNPDTMQVLPLTKGMLAQLQRQGDELLKQYEKDQADFQVLSQDWSKILDLKQQLERHRNDLDKYTKQYEEQVAQAAMGGTLQVVSDGDTPVQAPDKRKQFAFVGLLGGGGLPIAVLLLVGLLDGRMRYSEEAGADMSGMTLLGILPNLPDRLTDPAQAATAAHCVHQIRTMLQINSGEDRNVFAVTSASPGDGKTSLTLALGLSFAASGSRTLLIDCDLVGAGLTARLDMSGPDGVLEAMANRELLPHIRTTDIADLSMLPVGQAQAHHAGMFSPQALRRLLNEAKKHFEIILIDSGPVLGSIEATPVCAAADGVILTVSRGQQRPLVEKAIQHLMSIGARFAGVVFNRAQANDFARSISGISLRSIARQHQTGVATGNGHGTHAHGTSGMQRSDGVKAFGPVARAVASSVKPQDQEGL